MNAQGRDPSEWLLDQANASCDEILTGRTTLQELLDNLDKRGGVIANQDIIREFLAGLSNFDSIDPEPSRLNRIAYYLSQLNIIDDHRSSLSSVDGYRSITEEIIRPGTAGQRRHVRVPAVPDSLMELRPDFRKTANLSENMERVGAAAREKPSTPTRLRSS